MIAFNRAGPCVALLCALAACKSENKQPVSAPKERSQAVLGNSEPAAVQPAAQAPPQPSAALAVPKERRKLCEGQMQGAGKALPKNEISRTAAPGAASQPEHLSGGDGSWLWVNFWAAWCVPCKEEIPRLKDWEKKLVGEGKRFRLRFVSLDDDARQLEQFLAAQPPEGLRSTYWLKEGDQRKDWLAAIDLDTEPELPAHLLVDPRGKVRCVVSGAVDDADYPQVVALLGR
jgi:thiol-disulfide isomerase/thioredoxin